MRTRTLLSVSLVVALIVLLRISLHAAEQTIEFKPQTVKALKGVVGYGFDGPPIKGAHVIEFSSDWKTELRRTTTDSEGRFTFIPVRGRKVYYIEVRVDQPGVNPTRIPLKINRLWGKRLQRFPMYLA